MGNAQEATRLLEPATVLAERIRARTARAGVIGLGYVGLPLAVELGRAGFAVTGVDKDAAKVAGLRTGQCSIPDVESEAFTEWVGSEKAAITTSFAALADCDTVSISVPTPLRKTRDPDLSHVLAAVEQLAERLHPGMLVILESTTYPGTTEEAILPVLERTGMAAGRDFFLCFSPERVDPGNTDFNTRNIPKVIGGVTPACTEMGRLFYSQVMDQVVAVSSSRVAEMVKLMENTFRMINIGLANEMALMCDHMGIDVWEVIEAAATKPFGFMPFYPGPGLGGHCIPVDPIYLSWKTKQTGHEARLIELAAQINSQMPRFVVDKVQGALNDRSKPVKGSRIHIVGVAYKRDVSDIRESPALDIIKLIEDRGGLISYTDPFVPRFELDGQVRESMDLLEGAAASDCAVIVADHSDLDYSALLRACPRLVDTRNRYPGVADEKIVRL